VPYKRVGKRTIAMSVIPILFPVMRMLEKRESTEDFDTSPSGAFAPTHDKAAALSKEAKEDTILIVKLHILSILKAVDALFH
jgi:hypothetical protein